MAARDDPRKHLPTGTVTLFFADMEGSTRMVHSLGDRYGGVRARARELVRSATAGWRGQDVDWAGDGAFLVFPSARDAVAAAADLQRALADEPWQPGEAVRIRIGIHTGEPQLEDEGYVGMAVHVAARICAAAHGGQVVVSRTTRAFLEDEPLAGISFRPLGSHRLKDVPAPEQLFQLVAPGVGESFPPLRTLGGATLPALHHRLVGRRSDLTATLALLTRPDVRLVTITGPGGAGKSRLALEVAALAAVERPVHLVGLAPISNPDLVPAAIARALDVRESPGRPLTDGIIDALSGTGALLFLDNLEHLADAAHYVAALLDGALDLDVMTTSRAPLRLSGEHVVPLQPLTEYDASTLFAELAAARGVVLREDTLPAVREICRRLDGLPLAIELVAARLAVLPPAELLRALDEGLTLDMEGPIDLPERQRTLRATIDWSYGLLSESQRELHQTLAVFPGGSTLDDARALSELGPGFLSDLEALVFGSLVRSDVLDGEVRLSLLETVREDALARLASAGKLDDLRTRHAERFLDLAADAEAELAGVDQAAWLERLERELDNIRAALDWFLSSGRVEDALRIMSALGRFWRAHGHVTEARRWLAQGLALADGVVPNVRADALWTAARQAAAQSDWDGAEPLLTAALDAFRGSGRGREVVFTLSELAFIALRKDEPERAAGLGEEALAAARELGDDRAASGALMGLGGAESLLGNHERALEHYEEAVELRRALGDPLLVTDSMYNLGVAAFLAGDTTRARTALEESLALARELGEAIHTAESLYMLGELDLLAGDAHAAETRIRESLTIHTQLEADRHRAACLLALAGVALSEGAPEVGARLLGAAEALRGSSALEPSERVVLEEFEPRIEAELGENRFAELRTEGARLGSEAEPWEGALAGVARTRTR
jgi:predicted ATPase/class 3 adenylate cyclase